MNALSNMIPYNVKCKYCKHYNSRKDTIMCDYNYRCKNKKKCAENIKNDAKEKKS